MLNRTLSVLVSATALLLTGCHQEGSSVPAPATPGVSSVAIEAISPPPNEMLVVGKRVKMSVEVAYTLDAESGIVTLVVQTADSAILANHVEVVAKGSGHATLEAEFVVPNTDAIQIFTPLTAQGQMMTTVVDWRGFRVEP